MSVGVSVGHGASSLSSSVSGSWSGGGAPTTMSMAMPMTMAVMASAVGPVARMLHPMQLLRLQRACDRLIVLNLALHLAAGRVPTARPHDHLRRHREAKPQGLWPSQLRRHRRLGGVFCASVACVRTCLQAVILFVCCSGWWSFVGSLINAFVAWRWREL